AGQAGRARVDVDLDRRHGAQPLPARAADRRGIEPAALLPQRTVEIREEIVRERFCGECREREAAAVVVERGVDDEPRTVAVPLSRSQILKTCGSVESLAEDLNEGLRGENRIDPPEQ